MEDLKIVNADNLLYTSLDEKDITPQYLTKLLNEYSKTILLDNKICFKTSRTSTSRLVNLKKDIDGNDDDDGKNIPQESSLKGSPEGKSGTPTFVKSVVCYTHRCVFEK